MQLAQLDVNDFNHPVFINEYAYQPPLNDSNEADNLTESLSFIQNLGLFDFIAQKHGNIVLSILLKGFQKKKCLHVKPFSKIIPETPIIHFI